MPPFLRTLNPNPVLTHLNNPTKTLLYRRSNGTTTLSGGAIAGIVIGSIVGFLLLIWIIRSCTNLGAPPGDTAAPGKPWYGGVRDEYPPRHVREASRGRSRAGSRSGSRSSRHGSGHRHHSHSRSRHVHEHNAQGGRRTSVVVPVTEVAPVVVRGERGYYGYGEEPVRVSRSRSRGRY